MYNEYPPEEQAQRIADYTQDLIDEIMHCASIGDKSKYQISKMIDIVKELRGFQTDLEILVMGKLPWKENEKDYE